MADMGKVLKGLECLSDENNICSKNTCPYYIFESCVTEISHDALELLKELSEADEVAPTIREGAEVEKVICCGSCGSSLYHLFPWKKISKAREYAQYCRHCGKRVKWDDLQENLELLKEQTEIVRCKDCKHWNKANHDCNIRVGHFTAPPDWFCADGEVNQHE